MSESRPSSPTGLANYYQPRRGTHIIRLLSVTLAITFFYLVFTSTTTPVEWRLPVQHQGSQAENQTGHDDWSLRDTSVVESSIKAGLVLPTTSRSRTLSTTVPSSQKDTASTLSKQKAAEAEALKAAVAKMEQGEKDNAKVTRPEYYNPRTGSPFDAEAGLKELMALLPDEIYTRDLLMPIIGGGEPRIREVGLRARLFKKYFDAWEALHVVSDGSDGPAFVRDDVIQYLRNTPDLSGISSKPRAELIQAYEHYRSFMARFAAVLFPWTAPYFSDHISLHASMYSAGRGIVLTGNDAVAPYMITSIASFRRLGCDLPVEVFYLGDDDLGEEFREELEALPGVTTRDLKPMVADKGWELGGWASKAFSILNSSFREVLFLDADALFVRNPEIMFEDPAYVETGALFFYDRLINRTFRRKFLRQILPKPVSAKARTSRWWMGQSTEQQESGVMIIDKWKHFISMMVITRLNGPDRADNGEEKGVYSFFYGDKETFWLGFELAGDTEYNFYEGNSGAMGTVKEITKFISEEEAVAKETSGTEETPSLVDFGPDGQLGVNTGSYQPGPPVDPPGGPAADNANEAQDQLKPSDEEQRQAISDMIEGLRKEMKDSPDKAPETESHRMSRRDNRPTEVLPVTPDMTFESMDAMDSVNYTVCSPQLLHLGTDGRPLWFNGWIQQDKFNHDKTVPVSKWEYFVVERREVLESVKNSEEASEEEKQGHWADWTLGDHNMCCLKSDRLHKLTSDELGVLDMIVEVAKENGALA